MELTVLGTSAVWPAPGDGCAGYLVRSSTTTILLDCGAGILNHLLVNTTIEALSAILITHFHPDHWLDLVPMAAALAINPLASLERAPKLLVPPGGGTYLHEVGALLTTLPDFFSRSFRVIEYNPDSVVVVGDLICRFQQTKHDAPTWAVSVEGDGRLVYTSDTAPDSELAFFAAGADVLLCEAAFPAAAEHRRAAYHLRGADAGSLAKRARPGTLVLTHFWPGADRVLLQQEAEAAYASPVTVATPNMRLSIRGPLGASIKVAPTAR